MADAFLKKKVKVLEKFIILGFFESLIKNLKSNFLKTKWRIQHGGRFLKKL